MRHPEVTQAVDETLELLRKAGVEIQVRGARLPDAVQVFSGVEAAPKT